jgi:hypothetical protein
VVGEGADLDPAVLRRGLPFSDGTAQRVVFARCLGRAPDLVFTLSEAARVCAPGGEVVCQLGRDGDPRDLRVVTPAMLRWFAVPGRGGFALEEERADVVRLRCLKTTGPTPQVRRVDLGSGPTPRVGYVGVDLLDRPGLIQRDVSSMVLPFSDDTVEAVSSTHCLEHVADLVFVMNEVHRVCCADATVELAVPTLLGPWALADPTHRRFFNARTFSYFERGAPTWQEGYGGIRGAFEILEQHVGPTLTVRLRVVKP